MHFILTLSIVAVSQFAASFIGNRMLVEYTSGHERVYILAQTLPVALLAFFLPLLLSKDKNQAAALSNVPRTFIPVLSGIACGWILYLIYYCIFVLHPTAGNTERALSAVLTIVYIMISSGASLIAFAAGMYLFKRRAA